MMKLDSNCSVDSIVNISNDHNGVSLLINSKTENEEATKKQINWLKSIDPLIQDVFNKELDGIISDCIDLGCEEFNKHMVEAESKDECEVKFDLKN